MEKELSASAIADIRRKKQRNHKLILTFLASKEILPNLVKETPFKTYSIQPILDADKSSVQSISIVFDKKCKMTISDYFICAIRIDNPKKKYVKTIAFAKSKDLEADMRKALKELDLLKEGVDSK